MESVADELVKNCGITPVISTVSAEFMEDLTMGAKEKQARFLQVRSVNHVSNENSSLEHDQ